MSQVGGESIPVAEPRLNLVNAVREDVGRRIPSPFWVDVNWICCVRMAADPASITRFLFRAWNKNNQLPVSRLEVVNLLCDNWPEAGTISSAIIINLPVDLRKLAHESGRRICRGSLRGIL
jgi:hypothetical protein